jgi:hypothetical protein
MMKSSPTQTAPPAPNPKPADRGPGLAAKISAWSTRNPVVAILAVSLLAVVINCHPVIFCGRSYVSPASFGQLVYNWSPTLPGMAPTPAVPRHGSDTAAILLWGVPMGFVESRSLLEQGELPLWNRYSHAGDTLIGQAISMLGDPLHLIVILGHGSAVAWDIKYVAAKFLFCAGFGLLVRRLFGNGPLALIYAALGAYCGAFFFINNHPVFFVFCYAPWILLSALALLDPAPGRRAGWGPVWLLANFACFNAGHVEVAVVLIGGLNLAALARALSGCRDIRAGAGVLGRLAVATALLLALTAPVWMSFLWSLAGSYSVHEQIQVNQLSLNHLPGAFDDLFYILMLRKNELALGPGTSLLILTGCLLSVLRWRQFKAEPFFWINLGAILLWGGCVFGWVPGLLLRQVPLLNRVGHVGTDFSFLLVIHLTLQSAYGFWGLTRPENSRRLAAHFIWIVIIFAGMFGWYATATTHATIPWDYFICASAGAIGAPLLFAFLKSRRGRIPPLAWAGIVLLGFAAQYRFGPYAAGSGDLLMLAGPRAVMNAPSKAVDFIKADKSGAFRTVGIRYQFFGDYPAVYGLEDIRSCAPLSNGEYIKLLRGFPGMDFSGDWVLAVENPVAAQPLLNLLNVKYVLTPAIITMQAGLDLKIAAREDFTVVENPEVWPRAFFADRVVAVDSTDDFIRHLLNNAKQPFIAVTPGEIEAQPGLRTLAAGGPATVQPATNYQLRPNSTAFDVHVPSAGMVCLTEGQARDFIAIANGQSRPVLTVNRAFKGIYLDQPGEYHVEFTYRPHGWRLACALFWTALGLGAALTCASLFAVGGRRKNGTPSA